MSTGFVLIGVLTLIAYVAVGLLIWDCWEDLKTPKQKD